VAYTFRYRNLDPTKLRPIGDRYVVQVLDFDEEKLPSGLYLGESAEGTQGWAAGVIIAVGNGHRLEVADQAVVMPEGYVPDPSLTDEQQMARRIGALGYGTPAMGDNSTIQRVASAVPMFFSVGMVIFMEKYSGREFPVRGRKYRFVSQVDCLGDTGVRLERDADGEWHEPLPEPEPVSNGVQRLRLAT
jgi:co-chaperonin GroES (HSP10)